MSDPPPPLVVRVFGDLACFTRPELKAERFSYPVMTPSAARGVLEAILWKPAIRWRIERIKVLRPIAFTAFRRNELGTKATAPGAATMKSGGTYSPTYIEERRQQRNTVALRDVDYVIEARFELTEHAGPGDNKAKFVEMFRRRVERGQCFSQPFLGCREFAASFEAPLGDEQPIDVSQDLGLMLWDVQYHPAKANGKKKPKGTVSWREGHKVQVGDAEPVFFAARLESGVMDVPADADAAAASIRAAHGLGGAS